MAATGPLTVFDPAELLRGAGALAAVERTIDLLRRVAGTELRLIVLPRANSAYVQSLLGLLASTGVDRVLSLDGTPPADVEYASLIAGRQPQHLGTLRAALRQREAESLFDMAPVADAARRVLVMYSQRERVVRIEATSTADDISAVARLLLEHVAGARVAGLLTFLRALVVHRAVQRGAMLGQLLLALLAVGAIAHHRITSWLAARKTRHVPARDVPPATSCGICLGTAQEDVDGEGIAASPQRLWQTYACNHTFHSTCSDEWLERNNVCPMCRRENPKGAPPSRLYGMLKPLLNFLLIRTLLGIASAYLTSVGRSALAVEARV